jgi:hypothetical protein
MQTRKLWEYWKENLKSVLEGHEIMTVALFILVVKLTPKTGPVVKLNFPGLWLESSKETDESKTQTT